MQQRKAQDEAEALRKQLSDGKGGIAAATPLVEALQRYASFKSSSITAFSNPFQAIGDLRQLGLTNNLGWEIR